MVLVAHRHFHLVSKILDRGYVEKTNVKGKKIKCSNYILSKETEKIENKKEQKVFGEEKNKLVLQPVGLMVIEFLNQHPQIYLITILQKKWKICWI